MLLNMASQDMHSQCPFLSLRNENTHSLSERINISTRVTHTQLNRLIIARLPLALPPYTLNPSVYISGLLHITPIYITFESLWQRILDAPCDLAKEFSQTNSILSGLRLPNVLRSGRLRGDIKTLSVLSEQEVEEQLRKISQNGKISEFIAHITKSVNEKPHVLLAYIWVMYMALFSGGRYLRASLQNAGAEFWSRSLSPVRSCLHLIPRSNPHCLLSRSLDERDALEKQISSLRRNSNLESQSPEVNQGLQFFHFPGEEDGEDIKKELKKRFAEAEILLSPREKDDIVQEAQHIFNFMVEMVGELDRVCGSTDQKDAQVAAMTGRGGVCIAGETLSRKQDSRAGEHDAFPGLFRNIREVTLVAWRAVGFRDTIFAVHLKTLRSRFFGAGSWKSNKHDSTTVGADTAFVLSVISLILAFIVWCFKLR